MTSMRPMILALLVGVATASAPAVSAMAQVGPSTLEDVRDQGILYFKKKLYKQAKTALDKAFKMPGGNEDFATLYYRGQTAFKLLFIEQAFNMTKAAVAKAPSDKYKRRYTELLTEMQGLFGEVTLVGAKGETNAEGRIYFEAQTGIINRAKKQRFMSIRERFRSTNISLPITVYLPWGQYTANKVPFALKQGEPAPSLEIFLQIDRTGEPKGGGMKTSTWVWIGVGAAVLAGGAAAGVLALEEPEPTRLTGIVIE